MTELEEKSVGNDVDVVTSVSGSFSLLFRVSPKVVTSFETKAISAQSFVKRFSFSVMGTF